MLNTPSQSESAPRRPCVRVRRCFFGKKKVHFQFYSQISNSLQTAVISHISANIKLYAEIFSPFIEVTFVGSVVQELLGCIRLQDSECCSNGPQKTLEEAQMRLEFISNFSTDIYSVRCGVTADKKQQLLPFDFWRAAFTSILNGITMMEEAARIKVEEQAANQNKMKNRQQMPTPQKLAEAAK